MIDYVAVLSFLLYSGAASDDMVIWNQRRRNREGKRPGRSPTLCMLWTPNEPHPKNPKCTKTLGAGASPQTPLEELTTPHLVGKGMLLPPAHQKP